MDKYKCVSDSLRPGQLDALVNRLNDSNPNMTERFENDVTKEIERLRAENALLTKAFDSALKMRNEEHAEVGRLKAENKELLEALKEVVAISDRKHNAWDKAHAVIERVGKDYAMKIADQQHTGGSYIDLDVPNGGWVWSMDEGKFVESEDLIAKAGGK